MQETTIKSLFVRNTFLSYQLAVLVLLSIVLMFVDHRFDYLSQIRYYASFVVRPVQWLTDAPVQLSESVQGSMKSRDALITENQALREQLFMQQFQLQKLAHLTAENQRLNELLNASSIVEAKTVRAQINGVAPDPFLRRVMINKGRSDGVFVGQAVLDAYGVIGQVVEIEAYASWVMLVTDPQHAIPVQINRNGIRTTATGSELTPNELELRNLPNTVDVQVGDLLVSNGLGGRFPAGYPVGVINSVIHDPGQSFAIVRAIPSARLDRSRNVLLVF